MDFEEYVRHELSMLDAKLKTMDFALNKILEVFNEKRKDSSTIREKVSGKTETSTENESGQDGPNPD